MVKLLPRKKLILFRSLVSVVLLLFLITMIDWDRLRVLLTRIQVEYILAAPLLLLIGFVFSSIRWQHLLQRLNIRQKIKHLYAYYLIGSFYNIFLPGVIGGDVIRIGICSSETRSPLTTITISVLIERIAGILALFTIASLVIFSLPPRLVTALGGLIVKIIPAATVLSYVFLFIVFLIGRHVRNQPLVEKKAVGWVKTLIQHRDLVIQIPKSTLLSLIFFSALFQAADILTSYMIAKALNIHVPLPVFFAIMPIIYILTILPVSLGGLGVREGTLVYLLTKVGVLTSDAVTLSFLIYVNRMFIGSIGGIIQLFRKAVLTKDPETSRSNRHDV